MKRQIEISKRHPNTRKAVIFNEYERLVRISKNVTACPLTPQQVIELESIWNISRNQDLANLEAGMIYSAFCLSGNICDLVMRNILRLSFESHNRTIFGFSEYFIHGVLITKILKKWDSTLSTMDSDILRAILIQIEVLRIIDFSRNNVTDELTVPIEIMTNVFLGIDKSLSIEQMLIHLKFLCDCEEYLKTVEFMENGTFIMKFHKPVDYDLEKFDIFNS